MTRRTLALAATLLAAFTSAAMAVTPENAQHLIVCPAEFVSIFEDLAAHRTVADTPSAVVALEDILAQATGRDDAETLRNYIVQLYAMGNLRYLLLGGDSGVVPVRFAHSLFYPPGQSTELAADLYYAGLDGDWDGDGDGVFAEAYRSFDDPGDGADLDPEIAIGRAPVSTPAQARRFVDGVLAYDNAEQSPHFSSALLMAEVLFPSDWSGGSISLDGAFYAEVAKDILLSHPSPLLSARLYENSSAFFGTSPLTVASGLAALGSGSHGTVFHVGTGVAQTLSFGDGSVGFFEIDALANAPRYYLAVVMSGRAGEFTQDCILEHLVTAPAGGAAGAIGFTNEMFPTTAHGYVRDMLTSLTSSSAVFVGDALKEALRTRAGLTFVESSSRWTSLSMILLGDPAMPFRSESEPVPLQPTTMGGLKGRY
jgi:Peptidase family C25